MTISPRQSISFRPVASPLPIFSASRLSMTPPKLDVEGDAGVSASPQDQRLGRGAFGSVTRTTVYNDDGVQMTVAKKRIPLSKFINCDWGAGSGAVAGAEMHFAHRYRDVLAQRKDAAAGFEGLVHIMDARVHFDVVIITMEFMDEGNLAGRMPLTEHQAAAVARQLVLGLRALHEDLHTLHRDLKPENVLINSEGQVKIADFGVSAVLADGEEMATDQVGSIMQMSPERLRGEPHGTPSDVWSLGITVAHLALGRHPFAPPDPDVPAPLLPTDRFWYLASLLKITHTGLEDCDEAVRSILGDALRHLSVDLRDFIYRCTCADPSQRATLSALQEHPFIKDAPLLFVPDAPFPPAVMSLMDGGTAERSAEKDELLHISSSSVFEALIPSHSQAANPPLG